MNQKNVFDLVIMGGGLAGQTLARQVKRLRPETSVLIAEKRSHPVREAAFKVGESTVEIGAHYFGEILGLAEHLKAAQLPKMGLRYFFSAGSNRDIGERMEVGASSWPPVPSFQLDRGRFENMLGGENLKHGVHFLDDCRVHGVEQEDDGYRVNLSRGERDIAVRGRWLVDASGRAAILKRRFGLGERVGHKGNAVWFRMDGEIDLDAWGGGDAWQDRLGTGLRRLSTNHLMGPGYWVWLIPLASGSTSVGVVADPALHPLKRLRRFEAALDWLHEYEPQVGRYVEEHRGKVQDFAVQREYAHGCRRVFSTDRWCITGEAGVFNDPFYSPGSDLIAISNTFIADMVTRFLDGENVDRRVESYNRIFLRTFQTWLPVYEQQMPVMGNAQVMTAKIVWDSATYWGATAPLFFNGKFCDLEFMEDFGPELWRFNQLNARLQAFFVEWLSAAGPEQAKQGSYLDLLKMTNLYGLQRGIAERLGDTELRKRLSHNIDLCEKLAAEIFKGATRHLGYELEADKINPHAITLQPDRWDEDGLFSEKGRRAIGNEWAPELELMWFDTAPLTTAEDATTTVH
ncbi:MAG: tryptophan 7-halogenase [Acidobacteriota bacterium]